MNTFNLSSSVGIITKSVPCCYPVALSKKETLIIC